MGGAAVRTQAQTVPCSTWRMVKHITKSQACQQTCMLKRREIRCSKPNTAELPTAQMRARGTDVPAPAVSSAAAYRCAQVSALVCRSTLRVGAACNVIIRMVLTRAAQLALRHAPCMVPLSTSLYRSMLPGCGGLLRQSWKHQRCIVMHPLGQTNCRDPPDMWAQLSYPAAPQKVLV